MGICDLEAGSVHFKKHAEIQYSDDPDNDLLVGNQRFDRYMIRHLLTARPTVCTLSPRSLTVMASLAGIFMEASAVLSCYRITG